MRGKDGSGWIAENYASLIELPVEGCHIWMASSLWFATPLIISATMICFGSSVELSDYFSDTYLPCRLVGCSPKTVETYHTALRLWARYPNRTPLDRTDTRTISGFAAWLLPGRSPTSVNTYIKPILAMLRYAADQDDIGAVPRFRRLREPKRVPLAFTKEEFAAILREVEQEDYLIGGICAPLWLGSFLCVDWESGLRVSAMLSITSMDMLLDQGGFYCAAEPQKDREGQWYPLSPQTIKLVQRMYDPQRSVVWPAEKGYPWLRLKFRAILDRSGIYAPKGSAFHRTRRSTASYIAAATSVEAARRKLGHSSAKTTVAYLDPRIVRPSRNTDLVPAPIQF